MGFIREAQPRDLRGRTDRADAAGDCRMDRSGGGAAPRRQTHGPDVDRDSGKHPATERACHLELEPGGNARAFAALATDGVTGLSAQLLDRRGVELLSGVAAVFDSVRPCTSAEMHAHSSGNRFLLEALVQRVSSRPRRPGHGPLCRRQAVRALARRRGIADVALVEGIPSAATTSRRTRARKVDRAHVSSDRASRTFCAAGLPRLTATFIVDPPRTGMSPDAARAIVRVKPKRVVYVSCDVATLARDARVLIDADYSLVEISGVDLFPNTAHVETVAVFDRS